MSRRRVAVLISGRGSNMESLARACAADDFPASICVVVSSAADAGGLEKAAAFGIPTAVVEPGNYDSKEAFEAQVIRAIEEHGGELICLAGFMRVLSEGFVSRFPNKILNIHPSLLPSFPGLHVQQKAIDYGVRYSGCTVHLVVPEVDAGPIVLQAVVPVEQNDSADSLAARILEQEHLIYPEAVRLFAEDRLRIEGRRVLIDTADGQ